MEYLKLVLQPIIEEFQILSQLNSEKLKDKYAERIKISQSLGQNGWVISSRVTPNDQREWAHEIEQYGEETILSYFPEQEIDEMLCRIGETYKILPETRYLNCSIENYMSGRYTEAATFLLALLDYRISCITPEKLRKKVNNARRF